MADVNEEAKRDTDREDSPDESKDGISTQKCRLYLIIFIRRWY